MEARNPERTARQALGVIVALAVLFILSRMVSEPEQARPATSQPASSAMTDAQKDSEWVAEMQVRVKAQLKDPGSAQFRNTRVSRRAGSPVVCGEVNSNNSMGGKSGFQRFVAAGSIIALEEQMGAGEMGKTWAAVC